MMIGIDCRLWNESGVGRYVRNLVKQFQLVDIDKKNQYVLFILSKDRKEILNQAQPDQNDNFKIVVTDIKWHTLEEQLRFPSILNKEHLDLMHFPYVSVPIFYNKPFVVTIHDLIPYHFPTGEASTLPPPLYKLKLLGYKFVVSQAAKKAKKIITVSNATKNEIVDHLKVSPNRVAVTYEGADNKISNIKHQISTLRLRSGREIKNQKYFLYIGNAYPHKNLDRLMEAFNKIRMDTNGYSESVRMRKGDSDLQLVLVGKEDYFYKRLKERVKKMGMERLVLFYGEATDEELSILYKNAKALIMPSLMEGFGLPVLEAMANKCLVLASDIRSLREICREVAVYFNPYDIEDLVRKMDVILVSGALHQTVRGGAHPESLMALGDAGQASMTKRDKIKKGLERAKLFSWQNMAEETVRVYEKCFDR